MEAATAVPARGRARRAARPVQQPAHRQLASLGWGLLRWGFRYLPSPSDPTAPLVLTAEQAEVVVRFYAVDPDGSYLFRRGVLEMPKGWGKSPLAAFLALAEFCGPVVFAGWGPDGQPLGRRWDNPWVQVAAVSEDQTENTYAALYEMLTANDGRAAAELGIDRGRTRLYLHGRPGRLEPVTASAGSREGQRVTFAILDETHLWTQRNGGAKLARTLRRNAAKMGGRTLETTNAPLLGERSVAEADAGDLDVYSHALRPSAMPQEDWTPEQLRAALDEVYGGAYWIDRDRLLAEIADPATPWEDALRFYFNVRSAGSARAVDPRRWAELADPREVPAGTVVGLGFDGSFNRDETWLRGCTVDGYGFTIGRWAPRDGQPVDRADVRATIRAAFERYRVGRLLCDPWKWQTEIGDWAAEFGEERVVILDTNSARRFAPVTDRWLTAIREGSHHHDGDPAMAEQAANAHLRKVRLGDDPEDGRTHYVLVKGDQGRIDGAVADALALDAAQTMPPPEPEAVVDFHAFD